MAVVRRIAGAAFIYFCALFTSFGVAKLIRDLVELMGVEPLFGQVAGALIVAFILLPAAGFSVHTFAVSPSPAQRLSVGVLAVLMMFALAVVELTFFRRFFQTELVRPSDQVSNYITLALLAFAAILPLFRDRHDSRL